MAALGLSNPKRKSPWVRRIWWNLVAFALVALIAHSIWAWWASRQLNREIAELRASGRAIAFGCSALVRLRPGV